jgi:TonB C terminal
VKSPKTRDIFRTIAENVGATEFMPTGRIDTAMLEERLRSLVGDKRITCKLTVKPSGRIAVVQILDSSGDPQSDKKAVALLKSSEPYVADSSSRENISYQIELPKLHVKRQDGNM